MMLAMQRKVLMVFQPFKIAVVLDNPLYDATLRKGAWSRLLYNYFPLACYSNHLPMSLPKILPIPCRRRQDLPDVIYNNLHGAILQKTTVCSQIRHSFVNILPRIL
jgi:hypothetical protein